MEVEKVNPIHFVYWCVAFGHRAGFTCAACAGIRYAWSALDVQKLNLDSAGECGAAGFNSLRESNPDLTPSELRGSQIRPVQMVYLFDFHRGLKIRCVEGVSPLGVSILQCTCSSYVGARVPTPFASVCFSHPARRQGSSGSDLHMAPHLTKAEMNFIDDLVMRQKKTGAHAWRALNAKRLKAGVDEVSIKPIHSYINGLTHRRGAKDRRGAGQNLITKGQLRKLLNTRRRMIREADGEHRVTYADVVEETGLDLQCCARTVQNKMREVGIAYRPARAKVQISEDDARKRLEFAKRWVKKPEAFWSDRVDGFFDVKVWPTPLTPVQRKRFRQTRVTGHLRLASEGTDRGFTKPRQKHQWLGIPSVSVVAVVSRDRIIAWEYFSGHWNGAKAEEAYADVIGPALKKHAGEKRTPLHRCISIASSRQSVFVGAQRLSHGLSSCKCCWGMGRAVAPYTVAPLLRCSRCRSWHLLPLARWITGVDHGRGWGSCGSVRVSGWVRAGGSRRKYTLVEDGDRKGNQSNKGVAAKTAAKISPLVLPPRTPSLMPLDYSIWQAVEQRLVDAMPDGTETKEDFLVRLRRCAVTLPKKHVAAAVKRMKANLKALVESKGFTPKND